MHITLDPDVLFQVPEESGAFYCFVPVSRDKILEMESKCAKEDEKLMSLRNIFIMS